MQTALKFNPLAGNLRASRPAGGSRSSSVRVASVTTRRSAVTMSATKPPAVTREAKAQAGVAAFKGAAAGMAASLAAAITALPALAEEESLFADFDVGFLGLTIDHKTIVYAVVISQFIGTIGAFVGGNEARKKTVEVEKLNKQILEVNKQLRRAAREKQSGQWAKSELGAAPNIDKESCDKVDEVLLYLRTGKQLLKESKGTESRQQFEKALVCVRNAGASLEQPWKAERKALRGLGAAHIMLGQPEEALKYLFQVLEISEENRDYTGKGDAYGVIADVYTDLGDFAKAAYYYDGMISLMNEDPMVSMDA